jgi:hypothetical protein
MANIHRHLFTVTSVNGVQANSDSVRVGGEDMTIQFILAPAGNLCTLEVSMDNVTWAVAEDNSGAVINNLGAVTRDVDTLAEYARMAVLTDAGGPRAHAGVLTIRKEIM